MQASSACSRPSFSFVFCQFLPPFLRRASSLFNLRSFFNCWTSGLWFSYRLPSESVASRLRPTSTPTGGLVLKTISSGISTVIETNHQEAVLQMRADRIRPLKRNFSAIFTRPSLGTSRKSIAHREFIIGEIERLVGAFLAFELGKARFAPSLAPLKEILEGCCHVHESPRSSALGDVVGPRKQFFAQRVKLGAEFERRRLLSCFVLAFPLGHRPVECVASRSCSLGKIRCLFRRRMEPDLVRFEHRQSLSSRLSCSFAIRTNVS